MPESKLHIAMYPWVAIGHITPFIHLANELALRSHSISILLPEKPLLQLGHHNRFPDLIKFHTVTIPPVDGLPAGAQTASDIDITAKNPLAIAFDATADQVENLLESLKPDIVFYDFADWIPTLAAKIGFKTVCYNVICASVMSIGIVPARKIPADRALTLEELQQPPEGYPSSTVVLRGQEALTLSFIGMDYGATKFDVRITAAMRGCDAIGIRTCRELEGPMCDYLSAQYNKRVFLSGPFLQESPKGPLEEKWDTWLSKFGPKSVVYCAFGSQMILQKKQFQELVLGFEMTGLPFFIALSKPHGVDTIEEALPEGGQRVPAAVYVFGDSLVDVGNNDHLALSVIKANFPHNGIDFPGRKPTGRFCNGRNAADFLAEKLGVATARPYLSQPDGVFVEGVSFASGGAGIFNTTDESLIKYTISLPQQVGYFSTVHHILVKEMGSSAVQEHLSKSFFPIVIGSNDIINYFNMDLKMRGQTPQQYVNLMIANLKDSIKGIYGLGARKFLFIGLPPIGCAPKQRYKDATNECNKEVNYWSQKFNEDLIRMLPEMQESLKGFHYSYFDTYTVFLDFIQNPTSHGFTEVKGACCGLGKLRAELPCTPLSLFCSNRSSHLFWDVYHPTEAAARVFITKLFNASGDYVSPITINQLLAL